MSVLCVLVCVCVFECVCLCVCASSMHKGGNKNTAYDFSFFCLSEDSYVGIQKLHFYFFADLFFTEVTGNKNNDPRTQILWTFLRLCITLDAQKILHVI